METQSSTFSKAFAEDHRHVTQGFWKLREALESGDLGAARDTARTLDRKAGPHIEFEETVFYPLIRKILGDEYVDQLYREHQTGQAVLAEILGLDAAQELEPDKRDELVGKTEQSLDHAVVCGTLLSHVAGYDEEGHEEMLRALLEFRDRGNRWTQLEP